MKLTMEQLRELRGVRVTANDGSKIGEMEAVYYDDETGQPEWVGIGTGFFGTKRVVVPVEGAAVRDGQDPEIRVPYSKHQVKDTPNIDSDEIPVETERQLYQHYGLRFGEYESGTERTTGDFTERTGDVTERTSDFRGRTGDVADPSELSTTRSEEELRVGKRTVESGHVRLRKWVETEPASEDVTLRRETAYVTREPVDRSAPNAQIGEDEVEVELHEEEPVVGKETIERERVNLDVDEESREETVRAELRKERVDVDEETDDDFDRTDRRGNV